jgi:hypothetical protein
MRSSIRPDNRPVKGRRVVQLLLIAALVVTTRAPFLLHADRFFDSDEAVEGLMASRVLQGEHPAFLWGQRYKGVPEVYLAAAVFAVTGPGVVALKSVTLACFALFVCLQFVLVERLFSRAVAWLATAFLILCPPALVLWSLSANAEIVMTLLAGTVMCLGVDIWRRTGSRPAFVAACAAAGFGLWVQQYILYYWIALALAIVHGLPQRGRILRHLLAAREAPAWLRLATAALAAVALAYVGLGAAAFLTGGFETALFGVPIGVRHAQKLWSIAAALLVIAAGARIVSIARRQGAPASTLVYSAAAAFAVGYAPALAAHALGGGSAPMGRADLAGVSGAAETIAAQIVPIALGFRSPTTGWLGAPLWLGLALVPAIAASFVALRERPFTPLFHFLFVAAPLIFLLSGAFVDAQSYRYLMPAAGAMAVVLALGVWRIFQRSRVAGAVTLAALLALFGMEQRAWYRQLAPDVETPAIIACLDRLGVRAAYADYWLSYKITFLTGERIVAVPYNGVNRYPPYSAHVAAQAYAPRIPDTIGPSCAQDISFSR